MFKESFTIDHHINQFDSLDKDKSWPAWTLGNDLIVMESILRWYGLSCTSWQIGYS